MESSQRSCTDNINYHILNSLTLSMSISVLFLTSTMSIGLYASYIIAMVLAKEGTLMLLVTIHIMVMWCQFGAHLSALITTCLSTTQLLHSTMSLSDHTLS